MPTKKPLEEQLNLFTGKTARQSLLDWANGLKPPERVKIDFKGLSIKKEMLKYPELFKNELKTKRYEKENSF